MERMVRQIGMLISLVTMPAAAATFDLTRPLGQDDLLPRCQVERTDTEFRIFVGEKLVHQLTHSAGLNIVADPSNRYGDVLLVVTKSLQKLREIGICQ